MQRLRRFFLIFFALAASIFVIFPELDITITRKFFTIDDGFLHRNSPSVLFIFNLVTILAKSSSIILVFIMIFKAIKSRDWKNIIRTPACFLLIALALGPALTVSYAFKGHVGRARPKDIIEFGGTKNFTAPFEISSECKTNCSFSSGHASMGYYFTAFSWIAPLAYQNIIFLLAFSFGSLVGFGRILQGGHFCSDTIVSFVVVMITNELGFKLWLYLKNRIKSNKPSSSRKDRGIQK